jgi:hypothetical protein
VAATKTTFTDNGFGDGNWVTVNGPWAVMRSGGIGNVALLARATGTTDEFTIANVQPGMQTGGGPTGGVVDVRFRLTGYDPSGGPVICQVVQ